MGKNKKILTVEDLVAFCESGRLSRFSSSETGYSLRVRVPATFSKKKSDEYTLYGEIKIMHTGRNRNRSNVTLDAMKRCAKNIAYKPLLANFCEIDGVKDFTAHDFIVDEDGNAVYEEFPIGCFTADEPRIDYDKEKDRHWLNAYCAIPREYTAAAEIIERKGGTKVSAELDILEMSYDSKEKELIFEDVEVVGVTCLGVNPETGEQIEEGMEGARLSIADFASDDLSTYDIKLLKEMLSKYKNVEKEALQKGESMGDENQNLNPEEPQAEVGMEQAAETNVNGESEPESTTEPVAEPEGIEPETEPEGEPVSEPEVTTEQDNEPAAEPTVETNAEFSANLGGQIYTFKTSLQDELFALTQLVNDTYAEADNAYYAVDAYADTKEVIMVDYFTGKAYKQSYKVKSGVYSLKGDRVSVHARYITDDEEKALDELRTNYSEVSEKLKKYEEEPQKMEVLNSADYSFVSNTEEFKKLKEQPSHFDLSIDETKAKADAILLAAAKSVQFSQNSPAPAPKIGVVHAMPQSSKGVGRYGSMFVK